MRQWPDRNWGCGDRQWRQQPSMKLIEAEFLGEMCMNDQVWKTIWQDGWTVSTMNHQSTTLQFDVFVQERRNSFANALELCLYPLTHHYKTSTLPSPAVSPSLPYSQWPRLPRMGPDDCRGWCPCECQSCQIHPGKEIKQQILFLTCHILFTDNKHSPTTNYPWIIQIYSIRCLFFFL